MATRGSLTLKQLSAYGYTSIQSNTSYSMKSILGDMMTAVPQSLVASTSLSENAKMAITLILDKVPIISNEKIYITRSG